MAQIRLTLVGNSASVQMEGVLTTGMVGVPVEICYDSAWDGLQKTLVCRSDIGTRAVLSVGEQTQLPPEVLHLSKFGRHELFLGVEGRREDGTLVIASTMAFCQKILPGANIRDDPSADPCDPMWAQILRLIGAMGALETEERENLVGAVNEVRQLCIERTNIESIELERLDCEDGDGGCGCMSGENGVGITDITITEE